MTSGKIDEAIMVFQKQLGEREGVLAEVQRQKASAAVRIAALETERRGLVVAARTGDQAAQSRLAEIDQECATAQRGIHDDDIAISQINEQIEAIKAQIAAEETKAIRLQLRECAAKAAERALENVRLAESLMSGINESLEQFDELNRKAAGFDLHLPSKSALWELLHAMQGSHFSLRYVSHFAKLENFASGLNRIAKQV